jgi:predicted Fe-Mo cluster-binding NifX family protein
MDNTKESRTRRVALATTDGLTIYKHFGRAECFHIFDVGEDKSRSLVEIRRTPSPCGPEGHSEAAFDAVLDQLRDCEAVIVGKIGPGAADYLLSRGMGVVEAPGLVEQALDKIGGSNDVTNKGLNIL